MAKDYLLPALSKLYDHFEGTVGFIDEQLAEHDNGEDRSAMETKEFITYIIEREIKELEQMKYLAKRSVSKFIQT